MKSLVLYSGGLDSTTCLAMALHRGDDVLALTFDYNQTCYPEVLRCKSLAESWGFPHLVHKLDLFDRDATHEIPARNTIFLAHALQVALMNQCTNVIFGAEPGSSYVDSSVAYIMEMSSVFVLHGVHLETPVKGMKDKGEVLRKALDLGVPLSLVHSSRTASVNGECKTSAGYFRALRTEISLNFSVKAFLDILIMKQCEVSMHPTDLTVQGYSFKFFPALFSLVSEWFDPQVVYTTKNWGADLTKLHYELFGSKAPWEVVVTNSLDDLGENVMNTDSKYAQWGFKQALAALPRPNKLPALKFRVTQGHFKQAVESLGYKYDPDNGVELKTE